MTLNPQRFGKEAEAAAEQFLRQKGYTILDRNVRFGRGELDIVARLGETLVFVEVKARRTDRYGGASHAVTPQKEQQLVQLAARYLAHYQLAKQPCRFDVLLYHAETSGRPVIEHIERAFDVSDRDGRW